MEELIPDEEELRQRLAAYADERLRPDPAATAQTRARLIALARSPRPVLLASAPRNTRR
jgi:hypothetical protein